MSKPNKQAARVRRSLRTRAVQKRLANKPRIVVHRSNTHIYSQLIVPGDNGDVVLVSSSTLDKELKSSLNGDKKQQAHLVGKLLGERAKAKQLAEKSFELDVSFDRGGYKYHGRVKALADGAREAGLNF